MKVLMLTIGQIDSLQKESVHINVIRALIGAGHSVSVLCSRERRLGLPTEYSVESGIKIVRLRTLNVTRCSLLEKGVSMLLLEHQFVGAIKKYFKDDEFDLVIYNTPPITLANVVKYCKKKFGCKSYLMLKDIFPQNAVDLGMMSTRGITGILYKMFRAKEKKLYKYSDGIGCMSNANIEYLKAHNDNLDGKVIELFPNAVIVKSPHAPQKTKNRDVLDRLGVAADKMVFIYGGNLGKPQRLDFVAEAIKECCNIDGICFIIVGKGVEKKKLFAKLKGVANVIALDALPKDEYERLCGQCDVGMVALDKRFTIPNYPSRMLSYLENAMPIFACTDKNTDVKDLVEDQAKCGKWCPSGDVDAFKECVEWFVANRDRLEQLGVNGYEYMAVNFNVADNVKKLEKFVQGNKEDKNV